jgi:hypothetical protein
LNGNTTRELFDVSVWKQGKHGATLRFHLFEASILMMQLERLVMKIWTGFARGSMRKWLTRLEWSETYEMSFMMSIVEKDWLEKFPRDWEKLSCRCTYCHHAPVAVSKKTEHKKEGQLLKPAFYT